MPMKKLVLISIFFALSLDIASAQSTIFVVRHAEKATDGDAKDPSLSEAGRARAEFLANVLKDANITSIYATEFHRTQQTAEPIAKLTKTSVTIVPAKETPSLIAKLKSTEGNALVIGHSNTIPEILQSLGSPGSITIEDADYDHLFVVTLGSPARVLRLHFPRGN